MAEPRIARAKPYLVTLPKKGRRHFWCACGRSANQPFCDGAHKGTGFEPLAYEAKSDGEEVLFCGCKRTKTPPFCDGSHNALSDVYEEASVAEKAAGESIPVTPPVAGKAVLDGGAFVLSPGEREGENVAGWHFRCPIGAADGARHLSQYLFETASDAPAPVSFGDSETILFVLSGRGRLLISGRAFDMAPETGAFVRSGEAFSVEPRDGSGVRLLATVCPIGPAPAFLDRMPDAFDDSLPARTAGVDPSQRAAMADRFYQVLIGRESGSEQVTEFIGEIPKSRAAAHRHLYEEAIVVLSGEGYLWTEAARAAVLPGDVIFLPRKQIHSLECTDARGMRLMGAFYPAGSPAVNY